VFDLDNTLYPHDLNLWQQIDERIRSFVSDFLRVTHEEAFRVQKDYYKRYGTTMRGLMAENGMMPDDFLEFVQGGGYEDEKLWTEVGSQFIRASKIEAPPFWRHHDGEWLYDGLFESMPLPLEWPVYVSHIEALAFTRWCSCRLPSESEWHRAFERAEAPKPERDNFDFVAWNPTQVSARNGEFLQLAGNGWEWTGTPFRPFPGFKPFPFYPGYSADFFDGMHFVMKGASPRTAAALLRPSFRNWFQPLYPNIYATFRCVEN
jgi:formylglycine-generating enzyme required for sulfatase activity